MSDEIRRSGRATKGQHTKNSEEPEHKDMAKKKGKGGRPKKQVSAEPETEEGPAIIRCICGYVEEDEDDTAAMICCDKCLAWQHNVCMGMPTDDDDLPEKYYCEQCRPKDHKELLAGIARGEQPWLARQAEYEREEQEKKSKKRKGGKKGRKSKGAEKEEENGAATPPQAISVPSPTVETKAEQSQKRKIPNDLVVDTSGSQGASKQRKISTPQISKPVARRRSSIVTPVRKDSQVPLQAELVTEISELLNPIRQRAANAFKKLFVESTEAAKKQGTFNAGEGQSSAESGLKLALRVEYALYFNFWGHGTEPNPQYGEKMRMMLHNVKANITLRDRLLNGLLTANAFCHMDSFDMASKEKQRETAQLIKETESQHIMIQEDGPRIRRTHKGEEVIEDNTRHLTGETIHAGVPRRRESEMETGGDGEETGPHSPNAVELPDSISMSPGARPLTVDTKSRTQASHRKSSSNFDINKYTVESPGTSNQGQFPTISGSVPQNSTGSGVKADAEIDSLLKDEEDDEPYSPMDYDMEPGTIWRGSVLMPTVADFRASAKFVAGFDLNPVHPWATLMPGHLSIEGRIDVEKASAYLCGLQWSKTINVGVVSVIPSESSHDRQQFDKLFAYFTERGRYGVVGRSPVTLVRDIYVVPLEAGDSPRPEFIELLDHCDIPAASRATRSLLVVYVVKVRPMDGAPPSAQATPRQPEFAGSPVAPGGVPPYRPGPGAPAQGAYPAPGNNSNFAAPPPPPAQNAVPLGYDAAIQVMGPELTAAPSVAQLIAESPQAGVVEFKVIKGVLEETPAARNDLQLLLNLLSSKLEQGAANQG